MLWPQNKFAAACACWALLAGPSAADDMLNRNFLEAAEMCVLMVRTPDVFRTHEGRLDPGKKIEKTFDLEARPISLKFTSEVRNGIGVHTCSSGPMILPAGFETDIDAAALRGLADKSGLIELNFKAPGLHFADCHNAPNAKFGLSVTIQGNSVSVLAVQSPAVGGVCAHSYGMQ